MKINTISVEIQWSSSISLQETILFKNEEEKRQTIDPESRMQGDSSPTVQE